MEEDETDLFKFDADSDLDEFDDGNGDHSTPAYKM